MVIVFPKDGAGVASLDSVVDYVNRGLVQERSKLRVLSGAYNFKGIALSMNQVPTTAGELAIISLWAGKAYPSKPTDLLAEIPKSQSYLKLSDAPFLESDGTKLTVQRFQAILSSSVATQGILLAGPPRVVRNSPTSDTCSVFFNIWDSQQGLTTAQLIGRSLMVLGRAIYIRGSTPQIGSPQCDRCWKWSHVSRRCPSKGSVCPRCAGPHREEHHRVLAVCCKGNPKVNPPVQATPVDAPCPHTARCLNCGSSHPANSRRCIFFNHRFDGDWIRGRYAALQDPSQVSGRPSRRQRSNSPPQASGSGRVA